MKIIKLISIIVLIFSFFGVCHSEQTYGVKIDFNQRVKMQDGVELSADVYRPDAEGQFPVILSRTPYNKNGSRPLEFGRFFASHGYAYVEMDVRGRGDSDGKFIPYKNDGIDGYDAIEWCAKQKWSTGKVGTIGGSYLAKVQWLTALLQPPHLVAMIVMVSPSDPFVEWPTGMPLPLDISWYHNLAGHVSQNMDSVDWTKLSWHLPLFTMDEAAGRPNPYWKEMIEHPVLDQWWEPLRYQNRYDKIKVPVLHVSGWYDDEQLGTPLNYIGMTTRGSTDKIRKNQKLLMGPWPHGVLSAKQKIGEVDFSPNAVIDLKGYFLRWYDRWLKDAKNGIMNEPPVRIFIMGDNEWRSENEWPIARLRTVSYYFHSQGHANTLSGDGSITTVLPAKELADNYTYDPADPAPFITEPSFAQLGGPDDYRTVEQRNDVLVYSTAPLTENTTICGPIHIELHASSSAPDTDFTGKLLDVWENGFAQRLIDGMVRARFRESMNQEKLIEPNKIYLYTIDLWNTCQTFKKGHQIRVEISSSAFPKYDRNLNTGEPLGKTAKMKKALQKIYHDSEHPSHIILPILPK